MGERVRRNQNQFRRKLGGLEPGWVRRYRNRWQVTRLRMRNRRMTTEQVFTQIYRRGEWGDGEFNSGIGTSSRPAVDAYIETVTRLSESMGFRRGSFVDLGCGDFTVGSRLAELASSYVGVDVVAPLVERNERLFAGPGISFVHCDIVRDPLPPGDVCFLRQVLQHLSNDQILSVVTALQQYEFVVLSEHEPTGRFRPNLDKPHGGDTRLLMNSGVVVTEPPFSIAGSRVELVDEVQVDPEASDAGVIRTYLITR